jgi:hypothetical protein
MASESTANELESAGKVRHCASGPASDGDLRKDRAR